MLRYFNKTGLKDRLIWHSGATVIGYVTVLHLTWAALVSFDGAAMMTTPLAALAHIFGYHWLLAAVFVAAAICATAGCMFPVHISGLILMIPQQAILITAASGAMEAILSGMYPDGTMRWWGFILADQVALVLLAPAYTIGILSFHNVWRRSE